MATIRIGAVGSASLIIGLFARSDDCVESRNIVVLVLIVVVVVYSLTIDAPNQRKVGTTPATTITIDGCPLRELIPLR